MTSLGLIAAIAGGIGLVVGIPLARRSHLASPLASGGGQFFHYLACTTTIALPASVITGVIRGETLLGLLAGGGFLLITALLLILHALFEHNTRQGNPGQNSSTNVSQS